MPIVTVNGIALYYEVTGNGPPLMFLHGLGSSGADWEYQVAHFSKSRTVITCDIRGHGRSEKPAGPYAISQFADDVAALMHHLSLPACPVVGISMGGMIAQELALSHPDLVERLILVNTVPRVPRHLLPIAVRWLVLTFGGMQGMGRFLAKRLFPLPDQGDLREKMMMRWQQNEPKAYKAATRAVFQWNIQPSLSKLVMPVYLISAEYDYWPLAEKQALFTGVADLTFVVQPGVHHLCPVESPQPFNDLLETYLPAPINRGEA